MSKLKSLLVAGLRDVLSGNVVREYFNTSPVALKLHDICDQLQGQVATGLVAQGVDEEGNFFASRGYALYRSVGNARFEFFCRLPCPVGSGQILRFPRFREALGKRDFVQLFFTDTDTMIVQSGGAIFRRAANSSRFKKVFRLRHWGRAGRGILYNGIAQSSNGRLFIGEYFNNENRAEPVCLFASDDDGKTWFVLHEYPAGRFRHIHSIQQDPFEEAIWMCTGDSDTESQVMKSTDNGQTFEVIGTGSQAWRSCTLLFGEEYVYWGADTERGVDCRHLYRFHRSDQRLDRLEAIDGAIEFAVVVHDDLHLYATTRVGYGETPDPISSLLLKKPGADCKRIKLNSRIDSTVGVPSGTKMYRSNARNAICLSFTNIIGLDNKIAIVPIDALQALASNENGKVE